MVEAGRIDRLPRKNYTKNPREVVQVAGEISGIRLIDFRDRTDMQRAKVIEGTLSPDEILNIAQNDIDLIADIRHGRPDSRQNDAQYMFGVAGVKDVGEAEIGELQGWISFDANTHTGLLAEKKVIPRTSKNMHVLEIMYGRHPNTDSSQMESALRQACARVSQMDALRNANDSRISKPQLVITASVLPGNAEEIHTVESAGFVNKGIVAFPDPENEQATLDFLVFVLDWKKLSDIMSKKGHSELVESIREKRISLLTTKEPEEKV